MQIHVSKANSSGQGAKAATLAHRRMFITVRFADDKTELFNPNCRNCLLLSNIKERCDCEDDDFIDLSDESGLLKHLQRHPLDYGTKYLNEREILVLVKGESESRQKPLSVLKFFASNYCF